MPSASALRCTPRPDLPRELLTPLEASVAVPTVQAADFSKSTFTHYLAHNLPVLIKGGARLILRNLSEWTRNGILADPAVWNMKVHVSTSFSLAKGIDMPLGAVCGPSALPGRPLTLTTRCIMQPDGASTQAMRLSSCGELGVARDKMSPAQTQALELQRRYFGRLTPGSVFQRGQKGKFAFKVTRGSGALPHCHFDTLNVLAEGAKRWIIVRIGDFPDGAARAQFEYAVRLRKEPVRQDARSPQEAARLREHLRNYTSRDWFEHNMLRRGGALLHGTRHYDFVQEAGDVLYVPEFASHTTLDLCDVQAGAVLQGGFVYGGTDSRYFKSLDDNYCSTIKAGWDICNVEQTAGGVGRPGGGGKRNINT